MASRYYRLMDLRKRSASASQSRDPSVEAGAYRTLEVDVRVPSAGSAGKLLLPHAAVPEEDACRTLLTFPLSGGTPGGFQSSDHFLRYLRWATDGAVAGNPQAVLDLVAKE